MRRPLLSSVDEDDTGISSLDRKIHFSAFAQGWLTTGFGARIGSSMPGAALYQGRNFGMPGADGARLRRAEAAADGNLSSRWFYHGMLDLAKAFEGGSDRQVLEDLYAGYRFTPDLAMEAGRQNIGLGVEGSTDDSRLLTIARSIMSEDIPVRVGRLGDIRSTGAALKYTGKTVLGLVGIWNDIASQRLGFDSARPPFVDASNTYIGITRLSVSFFGGTHVLYTNGETTDRLGAAIVWQHGPHLFQSEGELARDFAASTTPGAPLGTTPRGAYIMYGYSITRRLQAVIRYDNFDQAQQRDGSPAQTTETGILIPPTNHKLREYTLGINYFVDQNQKLQLNLIREDTEDNGAEFWGPQRTILMAAYQLGYHAPTRPESLRGAADPTADRLGPATNAVTLGVNFAPTVGFAAGFDIGLPAVTLVPGLQTRTSFGLLGNGSAPSIFGFPGTAYLAAVDQVTRSFRVPKSDLSVYTGFGVGAYFERQLYPGARLLLGTNVTRNIGLELITNFTGIGRPYVTLQSRIPL
jgi:hypothetical protein